jgi:PAS domain S-box-containing protein
VREVDRARQQSEERYRAILESIDEGFCLIEVLFDANNCPVDYRFLETNPAFEEHSGLRDVAGRTARELVPTLDDKWFETYGRIVRTGEPLRFVQEVPAMESRWFDVYAFRLGGPDSAVVGILFSNISERKHMERLQQDFVAMASHDLAGPVTVLRARAQLLQRRQVYDEASVTAIIEQTQRMERLIDDLRELVRLDTGHLELRPAPVQLAHLAQAAIERMRLQAPDHDLRLVTPDLPRDIRVDADRIAQVLDNLLGNSVKYSPGGVVTVTVEHPADLVKVSITDQGPGIDPEAIPRLFERFYRANARDVTVGLGLGQYIARTLVIAHGGQIWVESTPGQGSTFIFTLPRSTAGGEPGSEG